MTVLYAAFFSQKLCFSTGTYFSSLFLTLDWLTGNHLFYFANLTEMFNTYQLLPRRVEKVLSFHKVLIVNYVKICIPPFSCLIKNTTQILANYLLLALYSD